MLCVNFYFVALYNSAVMEFRPLPLEQRIKLLNVSTSQKEAAGRVQPWLINFSDTMSQYLLVVHPFIQIFFIKNQ